MSRPLKRPTKFVTDWSFDAEVGDFCIYRDWVCRLGVSSGKNHRDAGILYPRKIRPATEEDIKHARLCQIRAENNGHSGDNGDNGDEKTIKNPEKQPKERVD